MSEGSPHRAAGASPSPARRAAEAVAESGLTWLQRRLDRPGSGQLNLLREKAPVLRVGRLGVVTRRADVLEVLGKPDRFALPYQGRMTERFLLGLSGSAHEQSVRVLSAALRGEPRVAGSDVDRLARVVARGAEDAVAAAAGSGGLDVGTDLVHPVFGDTAATYLGVLGPDAAVQRRWARAIFQAIFLNPAGLSTVAERGERAYTSMATYVDDVVATRDPDAEPDDVLRRLLRHASDHPEQGFGPLEIRDNLIGLLIGWLWHGTRSALIAVDDLLDRPDLLAQARAAAARDPEELRGVLWEVLRHRPVQSGVLRLCPGAVTVAAGTAREKRFPAGTRVFVGTHSAMWDRTAVPDPTSFDPTRAPDQYLIFGAGPHRCFGQSLMRSQLPLLLRPLLARDGLARAGGTRGRMRWDRLAPDGFRVTFAAG